MGVLGLDEAGSGMRGRALAQKTEAPERKTEQSVSKLLYSLMKWPGAGTGFPGSVAAEERPLNSAHNTWLRSWCVEVPCVGRALSGR